MTQAVAQVRNVVQRSGFANPLTLGLLVTTASFVKVYADDELLTSGADYELTGVGEADGVSIEIIGAEDVDNYVGYETFTALYDPPLDQQVDLSSGGRLGASYEAGLDQANRRLQALADPVSRSLRLPPNMDVDGELPWPPGDGEVPIWDETSGSIIWGGPAGAAAASAAAAAASAAEAAAAESAAEAAQAAAETAAGAFPPGGADGQVLTKQSATDYDVSWEDVVAGVGAAVSRSALKALDTASATVAVLKESGRQGTFVFMSGDYSSWVAADTSEGIYLEADDTAATIGAWVRVYAGSFNPRWFGAVGDNATNDTAAINNALELAYLIGVPLYLPGGFIFRVDESTPGSTYALLNRGVPVHGDGKNVSIIAPMATMPSTASFMRIRPDGNCDYLFLRDFLIYANVDGTAKGKYGVHVLGDQATNMTGFEMDGVYIAPTTDYSLRMENNGALNVQGVPANAVVQRCAFWEGCNLTFVGDSIAFRSNVLRATSTRAGVRLYNTDGSGVAGTFVFENNNVDCAGGAFQIVRGKSVKVLRNNIEQSAGAGANGAVIDIDGSSGTITDAEVVGNHVGIFGTATVTKAVRINAVTAAKIDQNDFQESITVATGLDITANASSTRVGKNAFSGFTTDISNSGSGTTYETSGDLGATDNRLARVDGTGRQTIQGSAVTVDDSGNISGLAGLTMTGTLLMQSNAIIIQMAEQDTGQNWYLIADGGQFDFRPTTLGTASIFILTPTTVNFLAPVTVQSSLVSNHATGGIGYATGAGGTVTQATSKSTGVTLNKATGQITMNGAALAADTEVTFTLTNSAIAANDILVFNHSLTAKYVINAVCAAGSAAITVRNITAGSLSEALVIKYSILRGATA